MQKILYIESDSVFRQELIRHFSHVDVSILEAGSVGEARGILQNSPNGFDLVICDIDLADGDTLGLIREIVQKWGLQVPVVVFTKRNEISLKLVAFGLGVDDYILKSVDPLELVARLEMYLRKGSKRKGAQRVVSQSGITVDITSFKASVMAQGKQQQVDLTLKEFKILQLLIQNPGKVFSRNDIIQEVWGGAMHVLDRTVDSHMCSIRRKLGEAAACLESVSGVGYRLSPDVGRNVGPAFVSGSRLGENPGMDRMF